MPPPPRLQNECPPGDIKESLRQYFQIHQKRAVDYYNLHKDSYHGKLKDFNLTNIDTPESRIYQKRKKTKEGDAVIKGIIKTVTNLKNITLYSYQLDFIKVIIPTLFKQIYREEWKHDRQRILESHGMESTYEEVFFTSPRRMGKTITLGYACLAILVNVKKKLGRPYKIAVFATTKDASIRFIDECEMGWKNLDLADKYHFDRTATKITITNKDDPTDVREMIAFCGRGPVSTLFQKSSGSERKKKFATLFSKKTNVYF